MDALKLIEKERRRQMTVEGYTEAHDDAHTTGELAVAGAAYAFAEYRRRNFQDNQQPAWFPWDSDFWKPTPDDRIRELVIAGALIVAEIERRQRAKAREGGLA